MRSKVYSIILVILIIPSVVVHMENVDPGIAASDIPATRSLTPFKTIAGDEELLSFAGSTGSTGNGSSGSPLTISNVTIESVQNTCGLLIMDTTLHLVIRNCSFSNISVRDGYSDEYGAGIVIERCANIILKDCTISGNLLYGVSIWICTDISVLNCTINGNGLSGICIQYSDMEFIWNNSLKDNGIYGIHFEYGPNSFVEISGNCFENCGIGLNPYSNLNEPGGLISKSNLVNEKPIRTVRNAMNDTISGEIGQLILVNCSSVIVEDVILMNCSVGITLIECVEITIDRCTVSGCEKGILGWLRDSIIHKSDFSENSIGIDLYDDRSAVINCTFSENEVGIYSNNAIYNCDIVGNEFRDQSEDGIRLVKYLGGGHILQVNISNNTFLNNRESGIELLQTYNIFVRNNSFSGGGVGIESFSGGGVGIDITSTDSYFENNTFTGLDQSILLTDQSDRNIFINNNMSSTGIKHLVYSNYYYPRNNLIDQSNILDGRPIYYAVEGRNLTIDSDFGQMILVGCENISIRDLTISDRSDFLQLSMTSDVKVLNNSFSNTGIYFVSSSDGIFMYNQIRKSIINVHNSKILFQYNNFDRNPFPWSDYVYGTEIDLDRNYWEDYIERYPSQKATKGGYYWDHPYEISTWFTKDPHPLVYPFDYTGPRSPVFVKDLTPDEAEAGSVFNFSVVIEDFHGISNAYLKLKFMNSVHTLRLNSTASSTWFAHFPVPVKNETIWYYFSAVNIPGIGNSTEQRYKKIVDTKPPEIYDISDPFATTGDPYDIKITALDNLPLDSIRITYWFGEDRNSSSDYYSDNPAEIAVQISDYSLESLRYRAEVREIMGNIYKTEIREIPVRDNDPPFIGGLYDFSVNSGEYFTLNGSLCWDNIGIVNYSWVLTGPGPSRTVFGGEVRITLHPDGVYTANLTVSDAAGNRNGRSFTIYVKPAADDDDEEPVEPHPTSIQVPAGPVVDPDGNLIPGARINVSRGMTTHTMITNNEGQAVFNLPRSWLGSNLTVQITKNGFYPSTYVIQFRDSMSLYGVFGPLDPIPEGSGEDGDNGGGFDLIYLLIPAVIIIALSVLAVYLIKAKRSSVSAKDEE
ncbi:MAG: right-handed parallel beta-helix repeat-containing protein [Thermoplasmatota archaeon]